MIVRHNYDLTIMIQRQKMPPDQQAWMLVTSRKQDLKKWHGWKMLGHWNDDLFHFGKNKFTFQEFGWCVVFFLFPSSTLRDFGWWWMVVAWFSLPLFSRKWDVKPTTGLFGTTFRPAEGGRFLPFSGNLLRMELASPTPFFREYEKYSWIWGCQNIYHISILEGSDAVASCVLL